MPPAPKHSPPARRLRHAEHSGPYTKNPHHPKRPPSSTAPSSSSIRPPRKRSSEDPGISVSASTPRPSPLQTIGDAIIAASATPSELNRGADDKRRRKKKRTRPKSNHSVESIETEPSSTSSTTLAGRSTPNEASGLLSKYMGLTASTPLKSILSPSNSRSRSNNNTIETLAPLKSVENTAKSVVTGDSHKIQMLHLQMAEAKKEAEEERKMLRIHIEAYKQEIAKTLSESEAKTKIIEEQIKTIEEHEKVKELITEAVTCGVCFDGLVDPHILSCGHVGCKKCLISWFRTPAAYLHEVSQPIEPDTNLAFFSKVCHVCRAKVFNRPARMYHLASILEPLGFDPHLPTAFQARAETEFSDPWALTFPRERSTYRIRDENDRVNRCPECCGEVVVGACSECGNEFSTDEEEEGDFDDEHVDEHVDEDDVDDWDNDPEMVEASDTGFTTRVTGPTNGATWTRVMEDWRRRQDQPDNEALEGADEIAGSDSASSWDSDGPLDIAVRAPRQHAVPQNFAGNGHRRGDRGLTPRARGVEALLDLMAEDDDAVGERGDDPDESDIGSLSDDSYDGSFIDDGSVHGGLTASGGESGSDDDGGVTEDQVDENVLSDGGGVVSVEEMRRRRVQRHARGRQSLSPEVNRSRRSGRIVDPDSE